MSETNALKPRHSYIGLIAKAILSTNEKRMLLSEIYDWIGTNYSYFKFVFFFSNLSSVVFAGLEEMDGETRFGITYL